MMEIIKTAIGVALGSLLAGVAAFSLCFNEKFLAWYTKRILKVSKKLTTELFEEDEDEELY